MRRALCTVVLLWALAPGAVFSQVYPTKPIRLVVPYAPGGTTDVIARIIAHDLGLRLGQQVVIENRPGAGATVGTELVARASPDGHTLVMSNIAGHGISPSLYRKVGYDPVRDFSHIALVSVNPSVLVVGQAFPGATLADYLRLAKEKDGAQFYATSGAGSSNHLLGVRLALLANVKLTHVPYRGAGPAMSDVIAGQVHSMFDSLPSASQHIRAGSVRAIAVSGERRNGAFPSVPTMAESGFPELVAYSWFGVSGPANLPREIVARLHSEIMAILRSPVVVERWAQMGADPSFKTPAEYAAFVKAEYETWKPVIAASGATAD